MKTDSIVPRSPQVFEGNRKYSNRVSIFHRNSVMDDIRLLNCALLGHSQKDRFVEGKEYKVDIPRFAEKGGRSIPTAYTIAVAAADRLLTTVISIDRGEGVVEETHLIHSIVKNKDDYKLSVVWHKDAIPELSGEMKPGEFLTYDTRMDSISSSTRYLLYMQLSKHLYKLEIKTKVFKLRLSDLKESVGLKPEQYRKYADFLKRVILPTLGDIHDQLGINIEATSIVVGRKVVWVEFSKKTTEENLV